MRADYYQLLDVAPEASPQELKAAYYRLAKRCHPDHNAGNPAAEERFKLVAEAYRTLGVPERRREYDNWLRLHNLYRGTPELEAFSSSHRVRPFHYSARRARERQERRSGRAAERPRARRRIVTLVPFTGSRKLNTWLFLGFYALIAFNLLPIFFRHMFSSPAPVVKTAAPVEEAPVSEAEARRRILALEQALRQRAEAGEAQAQYQLGIYLFNKSSRGRGEGETPSLLRRAASEGYRQEALHWLRQAAGQGHGAAARLLRRLSHPSPASSLPPSC